MCWFKRNLYGLTLGLAILCVFAYLFTPGYVLTLDMVFTPQMPAPVDVLGSFRNGWPYRWLLHGLSLVLPGWIVQKLMFVTLFLALGGCAYRFLLPKASPSTRTLAGLFYLFNPFVYTRFLAGQWGILLSYAFLPLVFYFADFRENDEKPIWKRALGLGLSLALIFVGSLHLGIMAVFLVAFQLIGTFPFRSRRAWFGLIGAVCMALVATSYWTVPALMRQGESVVASFDTRHLEAFKTVSDPHLGTLGNVLTLNGFWGEREPWARQWLWAKEVPWLWYPMAVVLAAFILLGIVRTIREKETRRQAISLLVLGILSAIFAVGEGDSFLRPINSWLFEHIGFWNGFRDSQKWAAILALVYAWFFASGLELRGKAVRIGATFAVILYTFPMLFGFWGQLTPVWYPDSWRNANEMFSRDPHCKALFLPWHQYYPLKFNHDILTANPARNYFNCEMIVSRQVELGGIGLQGPIDPAYDAIEGVVTGKDGYSPAQSIALLREAGIHYVVFSTDLEGRDFLKYEFLQSSPGKITTADGLTVYSLIN